MFVLNIWFITHIGKSIWCTAHIISSGEHRLRNTPEARAYYCIYGHCAHTITIRHPRYLSYLHLNRNEINCIILTVRNLNVNRNRWTVLGVVSSVLCVCVYMICYRNCTAYPKLHANIDRKFSTPNIFEFDANGAAHIIITVAAPLLHPSRFQVISNIFVVPSILSICILEYLNRTLPPNLILPDAYNIVSQL